METYWFFREIAHMPLIVYKCYTLSGCICNPHDIGRLTTHSSRFYGVEGLLEINKNKKRVKEKQVEVIVGAET